MANKPLMNFLLIRRNVILFHKSADAVQDRLILLHAKQTVLLLDNRMGSACVKAGDDAAIFVLSERELGLVAVAPRLIHANDRLHGNLGQTADTA